MESEGDIDCILVIHSFSWIIYLLKIGILDDYTALPQSYNNDYDNKNHNSNNALIEQ